MHSTRKAVLELLKKLWNKLRYSDPINKIVEPYIAD